MSQNQKLTAAADWAAKIIRKQGKGPWSLWVRSDGKKISKGVVKKEPEPKLMLGDINEAK